MNNRVLNFIDPTGHFSEDEIEAAYGVKTWDEVLTLFREGGCYAGRWGFLELLRQAQSGSSVVGINDSLEFWGLPNASITMGTFWSTFIDGKPSFVLAAPSKEWKTNWFGLNDVRVANAMKSTTSYQLISPAGRVLFQTQAGQQYNHLRLKELERIDKLDVGVNVFGIIGDRVALAGPGGAVAFVLSEAAELFYSPYSVDQLETGDPSGFTINAVATVADKARLVPEAGTYANIVSLIIDIGEVAP